MCTGPILIVFLVVMKNDPERLHRALFPAVL
jgi:hypothetical protein